MTVDHEGRTPLHYAAMTNGVAQIQASFASGIDPDARDCIGFTALHLAAQEGALEASKALLGGGATVDAVNVYGNTPLFVAVLSSRGNGAVINLLRSHGANPRHVNYAGQTPVGLARSIANFDVAQFFADLSAG